MLTSFAPLVSEDPAYPAKVVVLGSMPSVQSLEHQQYYAHPRNAFWPIMQALFGWPLMSYEDRCVTLPTEGVALWDVVATCERIGSADSAIHNESANDFAGFFQANPHITHIFFNGGAAEKLFWKHCGDDFGRICERMPSTSPAYASMNFAAKLAKWEQLKAALGN